MSQSFVPGFYCLMHNPWCSKIVCFVSGIFGIRDFKFSLFVNPISWRVVVYICFDWFLVCSISLPVAQSFAIAIEDILLRSMDNLSIVFNLYGCSFNSVESSTHTAPTRQTNPLNKSRLKSTWTGYTGPFFQKKEKRGLLTNQFQAGLFGSIRTKER